MPPGWRHAPRLMETDRGGAKAEAEAQGRRGNDAEKAEREDGDGDERTGGDRYIGLSVGLYIDAPV